MLAFIAGLFIHLRWPAGLVTERFRSCKQDRGQSCQTLVGMSSRALSQRQRSVLWRAPIAYALLAFAVQSYITQTHIHLPPAVEAGLGQITVGGPQVGPNRA